MGKRNILLFDGTWNMPEASVPDGSEQVSNIYLIWKALGGADLDRNSVALEASQITEHGRLFYIRGVGTSGHKVQEAIAGALGLGIVARISAAYHWFCVNYEKNDDVFVFGFSRGAFAARSFCGLLSVAGARRLSHREEADDVCAGYMDRSVSGKSIPIQYLGIFDTVGTTVERPGDHALSPSNVASVRHALALDEKRASFRPIFWKKKSGQQVLESWFVGAHSNIGGGYPDKNLSNIALFWILKGAEHAGLKLDYESIRGYQSEKVLVSRVDSWKAWLNKLPPVTGLLATFAEVHQFIRSMNEDQTIHESVFDSFLADPNYVPTALLNGKPPTQAARSQHLAPWEFS